MKSYAFALLAPILGVVALNQSVDASGIGSSATVARLATEQRGDDLVVSPLAIEQRAYVRARLLDGTCPDVLITGSSTVGKLADGMFGSLKVRNAYLGGPTVEDFEALTAVLRRTGCKPRVVIVGVDPWWSGNAAVNDRRWMSMIDDYLAYHAADGALSNGAVRARVWWSTVEERLNFETTRESAKLMYGRLRGTTLLGPRLVHDRPDVFCSTVTTPYSILAVDGHYITCPSQRSSREQRTVVAESYLGNNMHSMAEWREIADDRLARLERLTKAWGEELGAVVLVGMPYNPVTYRRLLADERVSKNLPVLDGKLSGMAGDRVEFLSLRDAAVVPCTEDEFEDSHHVDEHCAAKVARHLMERSRLLGLAARGDGHAPPSDQATR